MTVYELTALQELTKWKQEMQRPPGLGDRLSKKIQQRLNNLIPEKVHTSITTAIKQMVRAVLFGAKITTFPVVQNLSFEERETRVQKKIEFYRRTAAVEGAITGAGGIFLGLADFPLWLMLKIKLLFEIAALYGYDVTEFKERIYLLYIFKLTFSKQETRRETYLTMTNWNSLQLPSDISGFDWRSFQQEYRDYLDLAKLFQLIPGIGAPVGAYVNHRLTRKLGVMAMNSYRLRRFEM